MKQTYGGLSWWGYAGLALFAVHVVLLFFPPIPPDIKGSLWWWLTAYIPVALLLVETGRSWRVIVSAWGDHPRGRRFTGGLLLVLGVLIFGATLRAYVPWLHEHFHREEGLFEPIMLYGYLASAIVLFGHARDLLGDERKNVRFIASLYLLLGLEEIDYFGIFGGIFGRVEGVYAGSLHDLITLGARGVLSPTVWTIIAIVFVAVLVLVWWRGYLQPGRLLSLVGSTDFLWVSVAVGFVFAAAVTEVGLFGFQMAEPTLEETLELCAALCFAFYALTLAAGPPPTIEGASDGSW
ncbi:MAG: hypothetical protein GWN32_00775 [Gemmatimonadetes bacterium]|nr:hypothetical protein [Gemmatimonadota bacterium]